MKNKLKCPIYVSIVSPHIMHAYNVHNDNVSWALWTRWPNNECANLPCIFNQDLLRECMLWSAKSRLFMRSSYCYSRVYAKLTSSMSRLSNSSYSPNAGCFSRTQERLIFKLILFLKLNSTTNKYCRTSVHEKLPRECFLFSR